MDKDDLMAAKGERLQALREELHTISEARKELLKNGQSVSVSGAFSATKVKLDELRQEEKRILREIAALTGVFKSKTAGPIYE